MKKTLTLFLEALMSENPRATLESAEFESILAELIPELLLLKGAEQNILYHKEDVWTHSMMCVEAAAKVKDRSSNPLGFMLGALLHDIGKPISARQKPCWFNDTRYIVTMNPNHAKAGAPIAAEICRRLALDEELATYVVAFVRWHDVLFDINVKEEYLSDEKALSRITEAHNANGCIQDYVLFNCLVDAPAKIAGPKAKTVPIVRAWELIERSSLEESVKAEILQWR